MDGEVLDVSLWMVRIVTQREIGLIPSQLDYMLFFLFIRMLLMGLDSHSKFHTTFVTIPLHVQLHKSLLFCSLHIRYRTHCL